MRHALRRRRFACAGILLLVVHAVASLAAAWWAIGTADTNHDGRPDLWRYFDRSGRLVRVVVDNDYDGRPDATYEFDPVRGTRVRAVLDVDHDGAADEVALFRDGRILAESDGQRHGGPFLVPVHQFLHEALGPALLPAITSYTPSPGTTAASAPLHVGAPCHRAAPPLLTSAPRGPPAVLA